MNPQLELALEACREAAGETGRICYRWLAQNYKDSGVTQHHLRQLARLGHLTRLHDVRGGSRVYYQLNPEPVVDV